MKIFRTKEGNYNIEIDSETLFKGMIEQGLLDIRTGKHALEENFELALVYLKAIPPKFLSQFTENNRIEFVKKLKEIISDILEFDDVFKCEKCGELSLRLIGINALCKKTKAALAQDGGYQGLGTLCLGKLNSIYS